MGHGPSGILFYGAFIGEDEDFPEWLHEGWEYGYVAKKLDIPWENVSYEQAKEVRGKLGVDVGFTGDLCNGYTQPYVYAIEYQPYSYESMRIPNPLPDNTEEWNEKLARFFKEVFDEELDLNKVGWYLASSYG